MLEPDGAVAPPVGVIVGSFPEKWIDVRLNPPAETDTPSSCLIFVAAEAFMVCRPGVATI